MNIFTENVLIKDAENGNPITLNLSQCSCFRSDFRDTDVIKTRHRQIEFISCGFSVFKVDANSYKGNNEKMSVKFSLGISCVLATCEINSGPAKETLQDSVLSQFKIPCSTTYVA